MITSQKQEVPVDPDLSIKKTSELQVSVYVQVSTPQCVCISPHRACMLTKDKLLPPPPPQKKKKNLSQSHQSMIDCMVDFGPTAVFNTERYSVCVRVYMIAAL